MNYMIFLQIEERSQNYPPVDSEGLSFDISVTRITKAFNLKYWRHSFIFHNIKEPVIDKISYKLNKYKEIHYTYESWWKQ